MFPGEIGEIPGVGGGGLGPGTPPTTSATPPTVDAGGPYSGKKNTAIQLDGTVTPGSDPSPTLLWTIDSGGGGSFSDDTAEDPTFTPTTDGPYVLRLTATPSDTSAVADTADLTISLARRRGASASASPRKTPVKILNKEDYLLPFEAALLELEKDEAKAEGRKPVLTKARAEIIAKRFLLPKLDEDTKKKLLIIEEEDKIILQMLEGSPF